MVLLLDNITVCRSGAHHYISLGLRPRDIIPRIRTPNSDVI
jgi:hypothetical protein